LCLVHAQGFHQTTVAQFAKAAEVPPGNFYYYFKTKESLGEALIDKRISEYRSYITEWEKDPSPKSRLLSLVDTMRMLKDELVQYGCPIGSLTQELAKKGGRLAKKAGALFNLLLDWTEEQFKALGYERDAQAFALQLMSSLQGAIVVANALRRSDLLLEEIDRLSRWIQELPSPSRP
jgi:AcrR family transcriptional regulator